MFLATPPKTGLLRQSPEVFGCRPAEKLPVNGLDPVCPGDVMIQNWKMQSGPRLIDMPDRLKYRAASSVGLITGQAF
jgi:hypothetical protein